MRHQLIVGTNNNMMADFSNKVVKDIGKMLVAVIIGLEMDFQIGAVPHPETIEQFNHANVAGRLFGHFDPAACAGGGTGLPAAKVANIFDAF
jgi:hypothetical protein